MHDRPSLILIRPNVVISDSYCKKTTTMHDNLTPLLKLKKICRDIMNIYFTYYIL